MNEQELEKILKLSEIKNNIKWQIKTLEDWWRPIHCILSKNDIQFLETMGVRTTIGNPETPRDCLDVYSMLRTKLKTK